VWRDDRRTHGRGSGETLRRVRPTSIGVFDSGVGGLTVLREILRRLPFESTVYLGDNAAPYGVRTDDEVRRFSVQALDALVRRDVKALVVAAHLHFGGPGRFPAPLRLPVLGVVRPGRRRGAGHANAPVGVIAIRRRSARARTSTP